MNAALRFFIDRFIGVAAVIFRAKLFLRMKTFRWSQSRLCRKYGITSKTPVTGYDGQSLKHKRDSAIAYTSGSTREPKKIAYDRARIWKTRMVFVDVFWRYLTQGPLQNRTMYIFAPMRRGNSLTSLLLDDDGLPPYLCGLQSPHRIHNHPDIREAARRYGETAVRFWILTVSNPALIYATNPSTIATFFQEVYEHWDESRRLIIEMAFDNRPDGKQLPASVKAGRREAAGRFVQENQLLEQHHPGASRLPSSTEEGNFESLKHIQNRIASRGARERLARIAESPTPLSVEEVFPALGAFACWDGGYVSVFLEQIRKYLPESQYRHFPMYSMSTETIETIGVMRDGEPRFLPLAPGVLYEFIEEGWLDLAGNIRRPDQLEPGRRYSMIVSDAYGLRRYQTEDVFECAGMVSGIPDLRFVQRRNLSYSFTGEKLTGDQLKLAYDAVEAQFPELRRHGFLTCFPSKQWAEPLPQYRLVYVRTTAGIDPAPALADLIENKLGEFNLEFRSKIESRRLGRMKLEVVSLADFVTHAPSPEAQFKFLPLYTKLWETTFAASGS